MTQRTHRPRRGMATPTALTLLAFIAVLLAALGTWIGIDVRRSRAAADDAQLRQLLHAGALAAADASLPTGATDVPLPAGLADRSSRLTVLIAQPSSDVRTATVEASLGAHGASQLVQYARKGERWTVTSATFGAPDER